jgi:hypothetical protein
LELISEFQYTIYGITMPDQTSLTDVLLQMVTGFARTQELYAAVKLGIADVLAAGPKQSNEIARAVNAQPQALHRFLRKLVVHDLLDQEDDGSFRLTPLGQLLRSDHPDSLRNLILYIGEMHYSADQGLLHAIQTGQPAFDYVFGMPFFKYLTEKPHLGLLFHEITSRAVNDRAAGIVAAYDFSNTNILVDVGGGNGTLLAAILLDNPNMQGILFDLPGVAAKAQDHFSKELTARCQTIGGNFLQDSLPVGADTYLMSNIIHDWDDEHAIKILHNCCTAMHGESTLLLVEQIMPEKFTDAPATVGSDLSMLKLTGGRERTEEEYRTILAAAGLQLFKIIPFEPANTCPGRKANWAIIESKPLKK